MKQQLKFISKVLSIAALSSTVFTPLNAESLYPLATGYDSIGDIVAKNRGDILRVLVADTRTTSVTHALSTTMETTINNEVNQWLFSTAASGFGTHGGELPKTDITGENTRSSGGTETISHTTTDSFSVVITDVLPNGNLLIVGVRKSKTPEASEFVTISGIIRPWDITAANTIDSVKIYDSNIKYESEGTINNTRKKGWLSKINEILNPF